MATTNPKLSITLNTKILITCVTDAEVVLINEFRKDKHTNEEVIAFCVKNKLAHKSL